MDEIEAWDVLEFGNWDFGGVNTSAENAKLYPSAPKRLVNARPDGKKKSNKALSQHQLQELLNKPVDLRDVDYPGGKAVQIQSQLIGKASVAVAQATGGPSQRSKKRSAKGLVLSGTPLTDAGSDHTGTVHDAGWHGEPAAVPGAALEAAVVTDGGAASPGAKKRKKGSDAGAGAAVAHDSAAAQHRPAGAVPDPGLQQQQQQKDQPAKRVKGRKDLLLPLLSSPQPQSPPADDAGPLHGNADDGPGKARRNSKAPPPAAAATTMMTMTAGAAAAARGFGSRDGDEEPQHPDPSKEPPPLHKALKQGPSSCLRTADEEVSGRAATAKGLRKQQQEQQQWEQQPERDEAQQQQKPWQPPKDGPQPGWRKDADWAQQRQKQNPKKRQKIEQQRGQEQQEPNPKLQQHGKQQKRTQETTIKVARSVGNEGAGPSPASGLGSQPVAPDAALDTHRPMVASSLAAALGGRSTMAASAAAGAGAASAAAPTATGPADAAAGPLAAFAGRPQKLTHAAALAALQQRNAAAAAAQQQQLCSAVDGSGDDEERPSGAAAGRLARSGQKAAGSRKSGSGASFLDKMRAKLAGGRFRYLNEELYTRSGEEAFTMMKSQPELFSQYHEGFQRQTRGWPKQPVDVAIGWLRSKRSEIKVVADFGCGDAKIAASVPQVVHSFDLVASVPGVIACNMSAIPLPEEAVDAAIFSLALMGTDYGSFLEEAVRVLKPKGWLWIAEVRSRFARGGGGDSDADGSDGDADGGAAAAVAAGEEDFRPFLSCLKRLGLRFVSEDAGNKMFVVWVFRKGDGGGRARGKRRSNSEIPWPELKACVYKKR